MTNKRALISVSDKTGIVELAQELTKLGWDIISTGGTKVALDQAGIATIAIDDVTGFPEMMDGRVKTLHPKIQPVKPEGAKIIVFHGEINPPDAVNGGGGKWYRYVLPSQWIKDAWQ